MDTINSSGVRKFVNDRIDISEKFFEALDEKVKVLILDAIGRAQYNKRKTLLMQDI